jgi:4,5-dihydroxyphthalate decarboxylase
VVSNDVLAAHPDVVADLFNAFSEAKRLYVARLAAGEIENADDAFFKAVMDITGDPLPYGIEPNRRMLEAVINHAVEQQIVPRRVGVDELFAV